MRAALAARLSTAQPAITPADDLPLTAKVVEALNPHGPSR